MLRNNITHLWLMSVFVVIIGFNGLVSAVEIIMDTGDPGTSYEGSWRNSSGVDYYGNKSLYSYEFDKGYTYEVAAVGTQEVSLWWTFYSNRCTDVSVRIYDGDTLLDTVIVNQREKEIAGQWNVLGTYNFNGTARVVIISQGNSCSTCADAFKIASSGPPPVFQCSDGIDNDGDGNIDYPADPGCSSATDDDEEDLLFQCSDGIDNDGDGNIDYPADPGCSSATDDDEEDLLFQCSDGIDNDGDGNIDYPADPGCSSATDDDEEDLLFQCSDGIDNDGDGNIDYPADPGCLSATDDNEQDTDTEVIIIDNGDPGTSDVGTWRLSTEGDPYGGDYRYYEGWNDGKSYTFQTNVTGNRALSIWSPNNVSFCASTQVEIYDGLTLIDTKYVDQQATSGIWTWLGTYDFYSAIKVVLVTQSGCMTGADAIKIEGTEHCIDTFEPNNSSTEAYGPLISGNNYTAKICDPLDEDWYSINIVEAGTISLDMIPPQSLCVDYDISLWGPDETQVAVSELNDCQAENITYVVDELTTGRYLIRVHGGGTLFDENQTYLLSGTWPGGTTISPQFAPVAGTGQTKKYATGDDGDLQKGVAWPNPRFTENTDGTVIDNLTGLIWDKNANRKSTARLWSDALRDCNTLVINDQSDWRLPNIRELHSLADYSEYNPTLHNGGAPFENVQSNHYWSSTTFMGDPGNDAWNLNFFKGNITRDHRESNYFYVWCVRGGQ